MNKDVIYVEPEDDITDIILKIENSKEKIVALVPPKKAGVFRSVVNIKLIAKSGASSGKKVVLVTVDPSIVRLAGAAKIPVTKNLQTPPSIPEVETESETVKAETLVEEEDGEVETEEDVEELLNDDEKEEKEDAEKAEEKKEEAEKDEEEEKEDKEEKKDQKEEPAKSDKKKAKKNGGIKAWFAAHKKLAIAGGICGVLLIAFLVWAFAIAPAATITVGVKASPKEFSQTVSFTDKITDEKAEDGVFYLEEKKIEDVTEVEFEATGKKNMGEKAHGELTLIATLYGGEVIYVNPGDSFTNGDLSFLADSSLTMRYDKSDPSICSNITDEQKKEIQSGTSDFELKRCVVYANLKVTAAQAGSAYNIPARESGWTTIIHVDVKSDKPMTGGTDQEVTVVQQSDVLKAKESLTSASESENKAKLFDSIDDNMIIIESSFKQSTGEPVSTPGVGEEVSEGTKPKVKAVTTASVLAIDRTKVEEFITKKSELGDDKRIYEMKDPFVDNFSQTSSGYTGKLKTNCLIGPKITTASVVDMIKGKGLGDAQHLLKDIDGITDVKIDTSVPWVMSIPGDTNRITVQINVKDQNGSNIEMDAEEDGGKKDEAKEDDKNNDSKKEEEKKE